ncbi:glycosyl hydrolase family 28-related protein [Paenibacillus sp. NPDC093718]|uniref:glycosyl hydrolase family 28-related protein n=1 Tax=Paenibacillus sp. NPDC093718 TaxID=3390601 RepID=UPI003D0448D6
MSLNKTDYLKLHAWGEDDFLLRDEINRNFELIDQAFRQTPSNVVNVKAFGAKGDGITPDSDAINRAIASSKEGDIIYFPSGTFILDKTVFLLKGRTYEGVGLSTIFYLRDKANCPMFSLEPTGSLNNLMVIKNMYLQGNKFQQTAGWAGFVLHDLGYSYMENVRVESCSGSGFYLEGSEGIYGSTVYFRDVWSYGNDVYGFYISPRNLDLHLYGGDIGYNQYAGVYLGSPSSSINNAVIWGTRNGSGVIVPPSAPSVQIFNCHIEGHAGHGIEVHASHVQITGNKIYDNANIPVHYGLYDGVYVNGTEDNIVEHVVIASNIIYSGLYDGTGFHRHSVTLDAYHKNCVVKANSVQYNDNGKVDTNGILIFGLKAGDESDDGIFILSTDRPFNARPEQIYYEADTRRKIMYDVHLGWCRMLVHKKDINYGTGSVPANAKTLTISFSTVMPTANYSLSFATNWFTQVRHIDKTVNGFTVEFETPCPNIGGYFDWSLFLP